MNNKIQERENKSSKKLEIIKTKHSKLKKKESPQQFLQKIKIQSKSSLVNSFFHSQYTINPNFRIVKKLIFNRYFNPLPTSCFDIRLHVF